MTDILMPKLSDSMEQGVVLRWLIEDGQVVKAGDELVEIETDKATMTYEAEVEGRLSIVVSEGTTVAVGEVIARVGTAVATAPPPQTAAEVNSAPRTDRPPATPLARRLAEKHGVALAELKGSGPRGRITKADVLTAAGVEQPRARSTAPPPSPNVNGARELTRVQQLIARRMVEAKATIPHFQVQTEVRVDDALALRERFRQAAADVPAPSLNDLVVKASALALRRHPRANSSYRENRFELHDRINVGVAVAGDDALIVPTVFDADTKSLGQIARETKRLAERARSGEITPSELASGTFTVSNLGMYGMTAITPVINPPQAAILGVGAARPALARVDEQIVERSFLTLTLSCDHRILYGADAARFLAEIKDLLEQPLRLCL